MLGDAPLSEVSASSPIDLVVRFLADATAVAVWHQEPVIVHGRDFAPDETWTFYGVLVREFKDGFFHIEVVSETLCFRKPPYNMEAFSRMKEVCAGIGGITAGFSASGGSAVAFLERTPIACATLKLNHVHVIQGDLHDRAKRIQLHAVEADKGAILSAGVPCQGFSRLGDQKRFADARSRTLIPVLQCAWHMQSCGVILECVSEILQHPAAAACLHLFAEKASYHLRDLVFDLADQCISRRLRWWAAFLPKDLPSFGLYAWPTQSPTLVVGDLITQWPVWSDREEQELLWTPDECQAFGDPALRSEARVLSVPVRPPWPGRPVANLWQNAALPPAGSELHEWDAT